MAEPAVLHGTEVHVVHSDVMDFDFEITIQGPPIEWPDPLPVVYSTDANFGFGFAANVGTMLLLGGEIPPVLTVGIGYPVGGDIEAVTARRMFDFSPTEDTWQVGQLNASPLTSAEVKGGGGPLFIRFMVEELWPFIAENYNVTDDRTLTIKQICEVVGQELGHEFAFVNLPYELAPTARPLIMHWSSGHRVVNTERLRSMLGYRDLVEPEEGLRRTVRWLVANPPGPGTEARLQDPFDYRAEDDLIARWNAMVADFDVPSFSAEPGYGAAYYGRDPNPATGTSRVETATEGKR